MLDPAFDEFLDRQLRTMRIIVVALMVGVLVFASVVVFLRLDGNPPAAEPFLTYVMLAVAVFMVIGHFVAPPMVTAWQRRDIARGAWGRQLQNRPLPPQFLELLGRTGDAGKLLLVYNLKLLVAAAPLEGAAFLLLVAYWVEGEAWLLAGVGLLLGLLAWQFPSRPSVQHWVEQQLELLAQERQASP